MVAFLARMKVFFHPEATVPEEEDRHKEAVELRKSKVLELREKLKSNPSLNEKIDGITAQLLTGVETKP